jgi:hypothetical protein
MTTKESDQSTVERNSKQNSLKEGSKQFAIEIIKLVEKLPKGRTALHAGQDLLQISFQRWVLLKKRLMSQYIGWNCLLIVD